VFCITYYVWLLKKTEAGLISSTRFGIVQRPFVSDIGTEGNHVMIVCIFKRNPALQFECIKKIKVLFFLQC
jgi:hypothetical protein